MDDLISELMHMLLLTFKFKFVSSQYECSAKSESSSSSSLVSPKFCSSNQDEQDVDVSLAKKAEDELLGGIISPVGVNG